MFEILVPDMNDSMSSVVLSGTTYYIRFCYNGRYDYWSIGLYDDKKDPLLPMTKIVPLFDLFGFYTYTDFPEGMLMCDCMEDEITRESFNDGLAHIVYLEPDDIDDLADRIAAAEAS